MDAEIRPSLPQGSPFLAYGTAPSPISGRRLPVLIAGILLGILLLIASFVVFFWRIPYPADASLLATLGSGPRHGYLLTENRVSAFDLSFFGTANHSERSRAGLLKLYAQDDVRLTTIRFVDLLPFFFARLTGSGFAIARMEDGSIIRGEIVDNEWRTDLAIEASSLDFPAHDLAIDLVALPDAWTHIVPALESYGLVMEKVAPPTVFGFSPTTGTTPNLFLGYEDGAPPTTRAAIAALAGLADRRLTTLPDTEMAEELFLPEALLADASSTAAAASGTGFLLTDHGVGIRMNPSDASPTTPCGDRTIFHIRGEPLETVRSFWNIPLPSGNSLSAGQREGKLVVCIP